MAHQIIAIWAQVGMGSGPLLLIGWGLWQMNKAIAAGKRLLDIMEATQCAQSRPRAEALGQRGRMGSPAGAARGVRSKLPRPAWFRHGGPRAAGSSRPKTGSRPHWLTSLAARRPMCYGPLVGRKLLQRPHRSLPDFTAPLVRERIGAPVVIQQSVGRGPGSARADIPALTTRVFACLVLHSGHKRLLFLEMPFRDPKGIRAHTLQFL